MEKELTIEERMRIRSEVSEDLGMGMGGVIAFLAVLAGSLSAVFLGVGIFAFSAYTRNRRKWHEHQGHMVEEPAQGG